MMLLRRSDDILEEVLAKAAKLPLQQRPTLALVLAALLASFSRLAADQTVLATPESAALLKQLIMVNTCLTTSIPLAKVNDSAAVRVQTNIRVARACSGPAIRAGWAHIEQQTCIGSSRN